MISLSDKFSRAVFAIIACFLCVSSIQGQQTASVSLLCHNIKSGGRPQEAADSIIDLMDMTPQKMLVLCQEANYARQYFDLPHDGWHHIWPGSPHEGRGNPIFTRDAAATLLSSFKLEMAEPWTHDQPKDPRVFTEVRCQLIVAPWVQFHCVNVHFPTNRTGNEDARQEAIDRLIELSDDNPEIPLIICGDFNMNEDNTRRRLANNINGRIFSDANVDHIVVRDGPTVSIENVIVNKLGFFGSDHHAFRYNFTFQQLPSAVADWNLY